MKSEGSMEPSPVPYNLRSRGRVVGMRLLRHRGVPVDNSCGKHYHRRRFKPYKPFTGRTVLEDPLSKEERKPPKPYKPFTGSIAPEDPLSKEQRKAQEEQHLLFLKRTFPFPFLAMQHYNQNLKEEDHYKVSKLAEDICIYYRKLGFVRLLLFEARPKSVENSPNSSDDVPTTYFFARVHQMPNRDTHVSDCELFPDPPESGTAFSKMTPVRCGVCGLENAAAFKAKSRQLRREAKARKRAGGEDEPESDYDEGFLDPGPRECYWKVFDFSKKKKKKRVRC